MSNKNFPATLVVLLMVFAAGCTNNTPTSQKFDLVLGSHGISSGKFHRPRGIVHDPVHDVIFVVDWSGRIQKFTREGAFRASWLMPKVDKGKPEDLCIATNGNILVADTHYNRVTEFTPSGELVGSFGSYGREPGQFIYPVGICIGPEGNIFVSEYGENDRIQKFASDGTFLKTWGSFGVEPGQFQRPSGLAMSPKGHLYVADAVNHRIQVFDTEGHLLRVIGSEGHGKGEFRYPYDVAVNESTLYVLEYGNRRVQKMTLEGKPLDMLGKPGRDDGCFASPWRCAIVQDMLYVSDTDNHRVVAIRRPF